MSEHTVTVHWQRGDAAFLDDRYSRAHGWSFDGGLEVPASSSPSVVPLPMSDAAAVDPEEAYVASLSSCHMLWFLAIARKRGFVVDDYRDMACAELGRDTTGKTAITRVTLRPDVRFVGTRQPDRSALDQLHHAAHESCFIANSVRTEIRCEPVFPSSDLAPG